MPAASTSVPDSGGGAKTQASDGKDKEQDSTRPVCGGYYMWGIGAAAAVVVTAGVVLAVVLSGGKEDDSDSGPTAFEALNPVVGGCEGNPTLAQMQDFTPDDAHFVSMDFPLSEGDATGCPNPDAARYTVEQVLPAPPAGVLVAVPEPQIVRITALFNTQEQAVVAKEVLAAPAVIATIAEAVAQADPSFVVDPSAVQPPVSGRVEFSSAVDTPPQAAGNDDGPSTGGTADDQGGSQGTASSGDGTFAFDPLSSSSIVEMHPVAGGKVAVLVSRSNFLRWAVYDPAAGTFQEEEVLSDLFRYRAVNQNGAGPFFATVGGKVYFAGNDTSLGQGEELWSYDGETQELVADLYPGLGSSEPRMLSVFGGKIVCRAVLPNPGASYEFPTLVVYDPAAGTWEHPFPAGDPEEKKYYQGSTEIDGRLYIKYGQGFFVWDGMSTPTSFVVSTLPFAFGSQILVSNTGQRKVMSVDAANGHATSDFQTGITVYGTTTIAGGTILVGTATTSTTDPQTMAQTETGEYLVKLEQGGSQFDLVIEFNVQAGASGIEGRIDALTAFGDKLYFIGGLYAAGASEFPVYVYDGSGVPTVVGGEATFSYDPSAYVHTLMATSEGLYFKPSMASFSMDPTESVSQNFVAIRSNGDVETVNVGDMSPGSRVFEVHGVEYIPGTVTDAMDNSDAVILKLN